jgi:Ni,Fe-hydrogenase III small subunit/ferredoxin
VSPWVLRGLREGVVTTRWPARPDEYADGWRGPATVVNPRPDRAEALPALCPAGAISTGGDGGVRLDRGRCILCGRCVEQRPDVFGWSRGIAGAALTPGALVVPEETERDLAGVRAALRRRTAALRRSVHLRHVDAGSDGSEEQEIQALLNPVYDIHRLGMFFTASPRHADVLLVTGAGAHGMAEPLRRTWDGTPDPKVVIAVGTDACTGGMMTGSYAVSGGIGTIVGVDVWVPGSPPPPFSILYALLAALGRLPGGGEP